MTFVFGRHTLFIVILEEGKCPTKDLPRNSARRNTLTVKEKTVYFL